MPFQLATADLIKTLVPGAPATRGAFSNQRRPWTPGYRAKAEALAASKLVGVNHPGSMSSKVLFIQGHGDNAGAAAAGEAYDLTTAQAAQIGSLPTTADITDCANYANAILLAYPTGQRSLATLVPRIATGAADPANGPFWRVTDADTFAAAAGGADGAFTDYPTNYTLELIVPAAADIVSLWAPAAAGVTVVSLMDFLFAGVVGGNAGTVVLNRIFQ